MFSFNNITLNLESHVSTSEELVYEVGKQLKADGKEVKVINLDAIPRISVNDQEYHIYITAGVGQSIGFQKAVLKRV
jgi:hypothetical protein